MQTNNEEAQPPLSLAPLMKEQYMDKKYDTLSNDVSGLQRKSAQFEDRLNKFANGKVKHEESIGSQLDAIRREQAESEKKLRDEVKRNHVVFSAPDYASRIKEAVNGLEHKLCQVLRKEQAESLSKLVQQLTTSEAAKFTELLNLHQEILDNQLMLRRSQGELADSMKGLRLLVEDLIESIHEGNNAVPVINRDLAYELANKDTKHGAIFDPQDNAKGGNASSYESLEKLGKVMVAEESNDAKTQAQGQEEHMDEPAYTIKVPDPSADLRQIRYAVAVVIIILIAIVVCISVEESGEYLYCRRLPRGRDSNMLAFIDM
ncbi:hypothetical protein M422DRAFT_44412 [Sphaerobolus stellatus SS14]|nr:hypothetical protein M422DRAFT_44412 [Sphaerobolus stellatus SS14]